MAFATVEDVETRRNEQFDAATTLQVSALLDDATAIIKQYTGQTIEAVAGDTETHYPGDASKIVLKQFPVTAVNSLTVDGNVIPSDQYRVDLPSGVITRLGTVWTRYAISGWGNAPVVVDYDHGWATIPAAIVSVTVGMVSRALDHGAGGIQSLQLTDYQIRFADADPGIGLRPHELKILSAFGNPVVA